MKVAAVQCDAKGCGNIEVPEEGAALPYSWLLVDIYQEGEGNLEGKVFCSWSCVNAFTQREVAPVKRKRRTRAQMEADALAAAAAYKTKKDNEESEFFGSQGDDPHGIDPP